MHLVYLWLAGIVIFILAEAFTMQLVSIWFAVASFFTMLVAYAGVSLSIQIAVFAILSGILLYFAMPVTRKFLKRGKATNTNADRIIGEIAVVLEDIDPVSETGQIKVMHQIWSAKSADGTRIPKNSMVKVNLIEGVRAVVELSIANTNK